MLISNKQAGLKILIQLGSSTNYFRLIIRDVHDSDARVILFNKPYQVLCQFTDEAGRTTLADYINIPNFYAAGRLDYDSEGLVVLTDSGPLQHRIADPRHKLPKTYLVQIEGTPTDSAVRQLRRGVSLRDGMTRRAEVETIAPPLIWERQPPIRVRRNIPTAWLRLTITEGRNRQVRRMTAAVGLPTLRLIRERIGPWMLGEMQPGEWTMASGRRPITNPAGHFR